MGDSSHMHDFSWIGRIYEELFDNGAFASVVNDVDIGGVASMGRPDFNTEGMEIVVLWVVLHCNSMRLVGLYARTNDVGFVLGQ